MTTWFTSDHHFGHANIIKYCNRPFDSVEDMDAALIDRWNKVVQPDDTVYHLGDFTLDDGAVAEQRFNALNGHIKILINPWHHDRRWIKSWHDHGPFDMYTPYTTIELLPPMVVLEIPELGNGVHPQAIVLCHYPLGEWDRKHHGSWHLHGHSHGNYKAQGCILDVGVDSWGFRPLSLEGVADWMRGIRETAV